MSVKRCPSCAEAMTQVVYIINGESIMFWECPEGDWEEPVDAGLDSVTGSPEVES